MSETNDADNRVLQVERRSGQERRSGTDRGVKDVHLPVERRSGTDRRQRPDRRRLIDPTTCERDYTPEEIEFMTAMDKYRRESGRPFPTWSEVLEVLHSLGYAKVNRQERQETASG